MGFGPSTGGHAKPFAGIAPKSWVGDASVNSAFRCAAPDRLAEWVGQGWSNRRARGVYRVNIHSQRASHACADHRQASRAAATDAPWRTLDDNSLMEAVGRGGVDAFATIVDRHSSTLYRVARRMLTDTHEAEDVVQECFARLWQNAPRWKPSGAGLIGWLHRVTMNLCFDRKRRVQVLVTPSVPDRADQTPLADHQLQMDETQRAIAGALSDLPERYRAALVLCYYEGFTNALAAEILDLNIKAMESLLFRARRQLRDMLQARDISCRDLELPA